MNEVERRVYLSAICLPHAASHTQHSKDTIPAFLQGNYFYATQLCQGVNEETSYSNRHNLRSKTNEMSLCWSCEELDDQKPITYFQHLAYQFNVRFAQ